MRLLILFALIMQAACTASTAVQQPEQVKRVPMEKSGIKLKAPTHYEPRVASVDPKTNEPLYYDPKPQIVSVDEKAGKYAFKWIGYDGKEKVVEYQRADAIDAVVSASALKAPEQYLYSYKIENLPSSATHLSIFAVQNFADKVEPMKSNEGYVGSISNSIRQFNTGKWIGFGSSYIGDTIVPGRNIELKLLSFAPPGLVECRVTGGNLMLKGAGEHMPTELENAMSGYEEWPKGFTIGPMDKLTTLSQMEHAKYLLDALPQLHQLGWVTSDARRWYEKNLKTTNLAAVYERAEQDLKTEQITTEVFSMIEALR
ncbi:MAG: hypothetical protein ACR2G4_07430 [Pyrinomonadaceae bacterium]